MEVTAANKAMIEKEKKALAARLAKERAEWETVAQRIAGLRFVAPRKVGENDVLYGSVTGADVADFLKTKSIEVDKRRVVLDEPIKTLGEHEVKIRLHPEVHASLKLLVTKEG
jgi:large subunit ribosomal protein L9